MLKTTTITSAYLAALMLGDISQTHAVKNKTAPVILPAGIFKSTAAPTADTALLKVGDKSPDIVFRDTTGHTGNDVKFSDLEGKYVLIDVWASWCYPCRLQHPYWVALKEKMKNKAIAFVSISIDTHEWRWKGPDLKGIQWMVRDKTFEKAYGINTIPRFILLDKKGNVLNLNMPMPSHPELEQELNKLKGI